MKKNIIVTAALPYANGSIHIGHLVEYIQADIFTRFLKLTGNNALYICASDMHGTPIEVNAAKAGINPEQFAEKFWKEHQLDFKIFLIEFDNYYKTHSPENKEMSELFFKTLKKKRLIYLKEIAQMYDQQANRFLPDRFIKGACPKCKAEDQYGDVCEKCGSTHNPVDLINPYSVITNTKPIVKTSQHYFFKLSIFTKKLKIWLSKKSSNLQLEIVHQLKEWLDKGLEDWCISRDEPYFGFEIPDSKKETGAVKYFYVWLDAPIGYISSTKNYCENKRKENQGKRKVGQEDREDWENYWKKGKVHHFIGKDIVYFHYLFWTALLMAMEIPLPEITTHGFLTVDGEKMSKSRGTFITAREFADKYPVEALRFYYASRLDEKVIDVDLNFKEFIAVNNHVLMGNLGNFCYRVLTFANKNYSQITIIADEKRLIQEINRLFKKIKQNYQQKDFKGVVTTILAIADKGNAYFQNKQPWKDVKKSESVVGWSVNLARNLAIISSPILPEFSKKVLGSLNEKNQHKQLARGEMPFIWQGKVKSVEKLVKKIDDTKDSNVTKEVTKEETFPLQLAVGLVQTVQDHSNANSLFILRVDFADLGKRQVVTSLKKHLPKTALQDKKLIFCLNLKSANFRGEESNAMILAAEEGGKIVLLEMRNSQPGELVKPGGMNYSTKIIEFADFEKVAMNLKQGYVTVNGRKLKSSSEYVIVKGISDQGKVR